METPNNKDSSQPRREISTQEASRISGLSLNHIALLLRQGKLEGRRFSGRSWMVYADSLERYLATPRRPGPKLKANLDEPDTRVPKEDDSVQKERFVIGERYGEKLNLSPTSLYSLASPNARWLMKHAQIRRFAVDDCIMLENSENFQGWSFNEIQTTVLDTPLPIPDDLVRLGQEKRSVLEAHYFNGRHFRLVSYTPGFYELDYLGVELAPVSFFDYYSLDPFLDEPLVKAANGATISIRQKYGDTAFMYISGMRPSLIPAPISLQCVVVTIDQKVVLMRRSSLVAFYPDHWSASFEKTMNAPDGSQLEEALRNGDIDFFAGAIRGLSTELAIPAETIENIKVISLNLEYLTLSVDVIVVIKIGLSSKEVSQNWLLKARNSAEAANFDLLSTDLHAVIDKLFSKMLWHPTARMRLLQFLFHTYGIDAVDAAMKERKDS